MKYIKYIALAGLTSLSTSCVDDLLNRPATTEVSSDLFWTSTDDALTSTYGVYNAARTLFATEHYYDGHGEFQNTRGKSLGSISAWSPAGWVTNGFSSMWNNAYRVINRANYTIQYVERMIEAEQNATTKASLEAINAENYFLRALAYFRLIENWGDVPYYRHVLSGNDEACSLPRTPIAEIVEALVADLQFAAEKLPTSYGTDYGRATQVAALAFKGKIELYYACWNKFGWPELEGFTPNASTADTYYKAAAADFKSVINNYGLKILGDGDPGTYESPTYWNLFQYYNENCSEIIYAISYGGPNLSQGESLLRDFGTRTTANAQCWIMPTSFLANRYQSTITGDFLPELILNRDASLENGARNRASYENRDWRMKSTIMWDGETYVGIENGGMELRSQYPAYTWMYGTYNQGAGFINNDASGRTGYIFRKWIRQEAGWDRTDGPQDFYLMRLADVYLMYAEAVNETNGPTDECVALLNKIRSRGNLPALTADKYANKEEFFKAIEQERIVELATEGHRPFDIRRWRKAHDVFGPAQSDGLTLYDTNGARIRDQFKNASELDFQKYYIYQIPESERNRNPNLTQNTPWR